MKNRKQSLQKILEVKASVQVISNLSRDRVLPSKLFESSIKYKVLKGKGLNPDNMEWFANAMETGTIYISILILIGIQLHNM